MKDGTEKMKTQEAVPDRFEDAVDIRSIYIDESKEPEDRIRDYLKQVKNPYFVRVGKVRVQLEYADTQYSFNDRYKSIVTDMIS